MIVFRPSGQAMTSRAQQLKARPCPRCGVLVAELSIERESGTQTIPVLPTIRHTRGARGGSIVYFDHVCCGGGPTEGKD